MDHGYLQHDPWQQRAGRSYRQAAVPRRIAWPKRSYGARLLVCNSRRMRSYWHKAGRRDSCCPGIWNAGSIAAQLLSQEGAKIIAISDSHGGIMNMEGLNIAELLAHKAKTSSVADFPGSKPITSEAVLELQCEILIPAALENQITLQNAERVQARIVAEAANGPTTPDADLVLHNRGIMVIPDVLANAGGVTVSYFEWVQDLQELFWDEDDVNRRLERIMVKAFADVHATARKHNVEMRTGAYILAIDRVANAMRTRGIW